jgi:hypothetical protein
MATKKKTAKTDLVKTAGRHTHRFKENPEEERFALAWARQSSVGRTLAHLLHTPDGQGPFRIPEPTEAEVVAVATVIQWLGSPVGQSFLHDLGYKKS